MKRSLFAPAFAFAGVFTFAGNALADVAPGCAHASLSSASSPLAAGLLAVSVGALALLWPRKK